MRTEKAVTKFRCWECDEAILPGERYAVKQIPVNSLFNIPAEEIAVKTVRIHLKHVYNEAQQKLNNKFFQLDLFGV